MTAACIIAVALLFFGAGVSAEQYQTMGDGLALACIAAGAGTVAGATGAFLAGRP